MVGGVYIPWWVGISLVCASLGMCHPSASLGMCHPSASLGMGSPPLYGLSAVVWALRRVMSDVASYERCGQL